MVLAVAQWVVLAALAAAAELTVLLRVAQVRRVKATMVALA